MTHLIVSCGLFMCYNREMESSMDIKLTDKKKKREKKKTKKKILERGLRCWIGTDHFSAMTQKTLVMNPSGNVLKDTCRKIEKIRKKKKSLTIAKRNLDHFKLVIKVPDFVYNLLKPTEKNKKNKSVKKMVLLGLFLSTPSDG